MRIVSVVGISGSGKTTTVENIIAELTRRRYTVGSVKEIHFEEFAIDTPGSNTHRHRMAGAMPVTARGLNETDVLFARRLSIQQILAFYSQDWVVLEGVTDLPVPRIVCAPSLAEAAERSDPLTIAIAGVAANAQVSQHCGLPVFDARSQQRQLVDYLETKVVRPLPDFSAKCCGLCGMSCRQLLAEIIRGNKSRSDCLLEQRVKLRVGDRDIEMVPFVQEVLAKTLVGLVSTLDGYTPHTEITVTINPDCRYE